MAIVILLSIIIILVVLLFVLVSRDSGERKPEQKEDLYPHLIKIIDKLQTGEIEGIEDYFKTIITKDTSKLEIYVIFANLLRERGHISEAISIHKAVLKRPEIEESAELKSWVLGNLSEDFRKGGMIDRALRTYEDSFRLNSKDKVLLKRYIGLCKQVGEYKRLLSLYEVYNSLKGFDSEDSYKREVAFVYNQLGEIELVSGNPKSAVAYFNKGISLYSELYPAYLNLAKHYDEQSKVSKAKKYLDDLIELIPSKAFLGLPLYKKVAPKEFEEVCRGLLNNNENDWRVRLELGRFLMEQNRKNEALKEFKKCIELAPMVLIIHQEIWKYLLKNPDDTEVFKEYANTLNRVLVFNNPFICSKCNYKSSEFLWKCPYCHEFDTFVELKI